MRRYQRLIVALLAVLLFAAPAQAATDPSIAARSGLRWLTQRQQADGSFPGFGPGATADAVFALVAAGVDPASVKKGGASPIAFLSTTTDAITAESVAASGKLVLAVVAAGEDPRAFGGKDLVALLEGQRHSRTGVYGLNPTDHAYAMLALVAAGQPIPPAAIKATGALQRADGGWSFDGGAQSSSDTNTTALMIQGLAAAGARDAVFTKALTYLKTQQNNDGGFTYSMESTFGTDSDANSTALAIQALLAAGEDPRALKQSGGDPISALLSFQNASGAFRYQAGLPDDNDLATAQAIPALLLKPFPIGVSAVSAPATLPATGGEQPIWLLVVAGGAIAAGWTVRRRLAYELRDCGSRCNP